MATRGRDDDPDRTELLATRSPAAGADGADAADGDALPAGARLGRYRIEALLGRGGMGEVYRAEQLEPVRRTVALKLLRARRLDARHLAYFEVERQLLAQMRHPAIAQVYDADTTPEGHPYFAMEFIAGSPVTAFCTAHALPLRARIALLVRICEGVQHAHQKGVIHRDLKPGNLLVDEVDGRALPKIIDFGIATATAIGGGREVAGTPDYMSPEQAGGDQALVDTRTDVYALGVVLYELLTGGRPPRGGETVASGTRTLRLPSQQLATLPPGDADRMARAQGTSVAAMRRVLRHELDWVVARAMRHDRSERYPSAAAMAEDLQRFLDDRPVLAVPQTRRYVWGRFARRHRAGLAAASVALAALLGGLGLSLYGLQQAREQRAIAERRSVELEKVAAFQQSMLAGVDIEAMGASLAAGLRAAAPAADAPPAAVTSGADAAALARVLDRVSTTDLARGLIDRDILAAAERAIVADFAAEPLLAADLRESVAGVRDALGLHVAAAAGFADVVDTRSRLLGVDAPATLRARQAQVTALLQAQEPGPALALARAALADADALPPEDPLRLRLALDVAEATAGIGDRPAALAMMQRVHAQALAVHGPRHAVTLAALNDIAIGLARAGRMGEARTSMEQLVALRGEALGDEHNDTLASRHNLATMRILDGDADGALALQRELVAVQTRRLGAEHPQTLSERANLASMLIDSGDAAAGLPVALDVVEARARVLGEGHALTLRAMINVAAARARLGQMDAALSLQREVIAKRTALLGPRHPDTLSARIDSAGTQLQAGDAAAALSALDALLPLAREALGDAHPRVGAALKLRGDAQSALAGQGSIAGR